MLRIIPILFTICFNLFLFTSISFSQSIDSTLLKAYKYKSKIILDEFFMNWKALDTTKPDSGNFSDTVKAIYDIVNEFYGSIEEKYFVLQDFMRYEVVDTADLPFDLTSRIKIVSKGVIADFKPIKKIRNTEFVYLNELYLSSFMDLFKQPGDCKNLEDGIKCMEIFNDKENFLNEYIKIIQRGYISSPYLNKRALLSDPNVEVIKFNNNLTQANLYYEISCSLHVAQFFKQNGLWIFKGSREIVDC